MLELPEANVLAQQLNETVRGRRVTRVFAARTPHGFAFYNGDPADYPGLLEGRTIDGAAAWGGRAELSLGEMRLSVADGVNLRYLAPGAAEPARHQLYLALEDGGALVCTVQMYGGMWAYLAGTNDNFYHTVTLEKPSPLSDGFDGAYFSTLFQGLKPGVSLKALLATQQRIPGLGNGCLQDIFYRCGFHPKTPALALDDEERAALFRAVKDTLGEMTAEGGRDTEKDLFGAVGGYQTYLSAKTWKGACPRCGGTITRQAYLGGNVYFCAHCQPPKL